MINKPTYEELEKRVQELEQATRHQQLFEKEQLMLSEVLKLIDGTENLKDLLKGILHRMKEWSGCEAVGIRLKEGADYPYFAALGFPDRFVGIERHLCSYSEDGEVIRDKDGNPLLECMCGHIIKGKFSPSKDYFTSDGSFWTNCTTGMLATTTDDDRQMLIANRCISEGYESVALIPLRSAGEAFGLIHLSDHREGRFSPDLIATYRRIANYVAGFLAKRQARGALRKSESHLRTLLDTLPDLVWLKNPEGVYLSCNQRFERFFGHKEAEIIGKTDYDFVSRELADFFRENDKAAIAAGSPCKNEEEVRFADDGHRELLETIKTPMYDSAGNLTGVLGIARDITQRRQAEEAQRYQERLLQEMGAFAKVGGWEFDPATGKGTWTQEVARIHDLDPDSETSMELGLSFYHGKSRTEIENAIQAAIEYGEPYERELQLVSAKGIHKWVHTIGKPKIENGKVVQIRGSIQDITLRKAAEREIEHLNRALKTIIDLNQLIVRERDPDALVQKACRRLVKHRDYSAALIVRTDTHEKPVSWATAGLTSSVEPLENSLKRGELPLCCDPAGTGKEPELIDDKLGLCKSCPVGAQCAEYPSLCVRLTHGRKKYGYLIVALGQNRKVDDEERNLIKEMAGDLAYGLSSLQSESKRKSLESQLIQAQKMESVGRLAGGVAHDFNNMLSIIIGYTELSMESVDPSNPLHSDLSEILTAARHSSDITKQLLAFARKQIIAPRVIDLNDVVKIMLNMLQRLIGEDIDLVWRPASKLWPIKIDPSQVDQALANLCINARDAITGVGKIIIETGNISLDETYSADHPGFVPGDYVMLAVSDNGSGMDKETQSHLFEPFFTTKEKGKGTGLGLATVYGIVKQNKGFVYVYSEPGKGATFRIYLPKHVASGKKMQKRVELQPETHGTETVLLVEDEPSIIGMTKTILERLGYTVLAADKPGEAIRISRERAGKIHLMITDVVMPEMNGKELSAKLHKMQPNMKVLFMSGYTADAIAHRGVLDEGINFIQKPFSKKDLAAKVRETLG
jgi:PAS domain S-box-containing protein